MAETAIQERTETQNVVHTDANSLMEVISRAASDPNTDVDKLERLMGLYERITTRTAEQAFNEAMKAAQTGMTSISADANNTHTKSKYATYGKLDKVLRPIYTSHGFSISFDTGEGAPNDCIRVLAYVSHSEGFTRTYKADMPADGKGAQGGGVMTKTHATGAAMSYGMRYLLKMIFNVAVGEDDTDGNAPVDAANIDKDQLKVIQGLIEATQSDVELFCKYYKIEALPDLPAAKFKTAKAALEAKRAKQ